MMIQPMLSNTRKCQFHQRIQSRGIAMMLVILAVAMATVLAFSFIASQGANTSISVNATRHSQARYIAETGLSAAIVEIRTNPNWRTAYPNGIWINNHACAGGAFTIVGIDAANGQGDGDLTNNTMDPLKLTVTGNYLGVTHQVSAMIHPEGGGDASGLDVEYFASQSELNALSDVNWSATPSYTQVVANVNRPLESDGVSGWPGGPHIYWGCRYFGKINIPADGTWVFYTESDDGSDLYIDNQRVVNNDGNHSMTLKSGSIYLTKGKHDFMVRFYEWKVDQGIIASWQGPGIPTRTVIPASAFTRSGKILNTNVMAVDNRLEMWNNSLIDGWDSSKGAYGGSNVNSNPVVSTNTTAHKRVQLGDSAQIRGSFLVGPGADPSWVISQWGVSTITGSRGALTSEVEMPSLSAPTNVPSYASDFSLYGNQSATISANQRYRSLELWSNSKLTINGDVTIYCNDFSMGDNAQLIIATGSVLRLYVTADIGIYGNATANANSNDPNRLLCYILGNNKSLEMSDNTKCYARLQNPKGTLALWGNSQFYGTNISLHFNAGSSAKMHVDLASLGSSSNTTSGPTSYRVTWSEQP